MMLAGVKAIATKAQPPVKPSLFKTDNYCMHSRSFDHLRLKMYTESFLINNCLLKKIYLSNKAQSTIQHTFTKKNNFWTKLGAGASWAHP